MVKSTPFAERPDDVRAARAELIRLFENDEWEVTQSAVKTGFPVLQRMGCFPTHVALVEYVLDLLRTGYPMHCIERGNPPGSLGVGYVMNNADGQGLYIELVIEEARMGQPVAWLISFHTSKHHKP